MIKLTSLTIFFCLFTSVGFSQTDSSKVKATLGIFDRIAKSVKDFQLDTTDAPNDKITSTIKELRNLKGGFNINEAINFKIEEDRQKNEIPKAEIEKIADFFNNGQGKKWLDNATTWIYRRHFTHKELKKLVRFYKTTAGQKIATNFPIIMMQSLTAAEMIKNMYILQEKKRNK